MKALLYKIVHSASGRTYFGITSGTAVNRWKRHQRGNHNPYLHRAIRKHGPPAFCFTVVRCFKSWARACQAERASIRKAKELGIPLYNNTDGGDGALGYRWPKSRRKKQAERMRGNTYGLGHKLQPNHAEKLRLAAIRANLGKPKSKEHLAKMRSAAKLALTGKKRPPEVIARCVATRLANRAKLYGDL